MQHARRWRHGPELMDRITAELDELCRVHERVLVRLHVLGDFWSTDYAEFWGRALDRHRNLFVFGFTAHRARSAIGSVITRIRSEAPGRFFIRHSGQTGSWGSFTVDFPTAAPRIGDAPVCPEQRDGMLGSRRGIHCGNCGLCWKGDAPIAFVVH